MTPRVVLTLVVRDEVDVLAANLAPHCAQGVHFVIATDNGSVDGTRGILEAEQRAGRLRLILEPEPCFAQGRWVTRMARLAATDHQADWIINSDADEFWWPLSGDLTTTLAEVPERIGVVRAQRFNFIARPDDVRPLFERLTIRQAASQQHPGLGEGPLRPKVCHRADPAVKVAEGNHRATGPRLRGSILDDGRIEILHFPVRSRAQFARKVDQGAAALRRNQALPPKVGSHWRRLSARTEAATFDAVYADLILDEAAIAAGLRDGSLVEDTRLRTLRPG